MQEEQTQQSLLNELESLSLELDNLSPKASTTNSSTTPELTPDSVDNKAGIELETIDIQQVITEIVKSAIPAIEQQLKTRLQSLSDAQIRKLYAQLG